MGGRGKQDGESVLGSIQIGTPAGGINRFERIAYIHLKSDGGRWREAGSNEGARPPSEYLAQPYQVPSEKSAGALVLSRRWNFSDLLEPACCLQSAVPEIDDPAEGRLSRNHEREGGERGEGKSAAAVAQRNLLLRLHAVEAFAIRNLATSTWKSYAKRRTKRFIR